MAGLAAVGVFYAIVTAMYLRPTRDLTFFICLAADSPIREIAPIPLHAGFGEGYDGQAYYVVALDPWNIPQIDRYVGGAAYRYQRILMPVLAHVLSFGHGPAVHVALILLGFAFVLGGTFVLMEWLAFRGVGWGWALVFPLFPGTLHSLLRITPDAPAAALVLAGLYLAVRERTGWAALVLSLAVLTKETMVLVSAGLCLYAAARRNAREALRAGVPVAVLAAWIVVVWRLFGEFPFAPGQGNFVIPLRGILDGIAYNRVMLARPELLFVKVGVFNLLMIASFLVLVGLTLAQLAARRTGRLTGSLLLILLLDLSLSAGVWNYEWSITRIILPASALFLVHGVETGFRLPEKILSAANVPLLFFMLNWMNLHF